MKSSTRDWFEVDPFQEGYLAGRANGSSFENPYDVSLDPDRYFDWHDGFTDAVMDIYKEAERKAKWESPRSHLKERLIQCLYSMAFVAVCYIIGISLRYLLR